ncbi:cytochrome c1 [Cucumibacter marinus]|uniref:cytochrome c1 n=1 Tax=Cucumibacter marinus TaxID=1121252 RepID=UPI00048E5AA1|nr:cytochrome c1 [Cucumibacter marinus]
MKRMTSFVRSALVAGLVLASGPALAAGESHGAPAERQDWTFGGLFGTYDENQLQRGFQIFREVCSSCHSANLLAFRNLEEDGGPGFTEGQVKALAAEYTVQDDTIEDGERPGIPADRWPNPFPDEFIAKAANNGVVPPDFSVLAKARSIESPFPIWIVNYFTAYQEGGPDYIYNLLTGYHEEAPEGVDIAPGQYYNEHFPGNKLSMAPPLADGIVDYEGDEVPETTEQYAKDVAAFMMWVADPHLVHRKETGFKVMLFLVLFAGLLYLAKRKLWTDVAH